MSMYQVLVFKKNAVQNWPTKHVLPQDMQAISDCIYNFFRKLAEFVYVCVYVGLPNNKITYWNFKFLLVNYLKLSIPCTQSLPACEKLLKRKPIDYVHFTVCESGPQTHRYLGRVYLDYFQTLNYYDGGATDKVCVQQQFNYIIQKFLGRHFGCRPLDFN